LLKFGLKTGNFGRQGRQSVPKSVKIRQIRQNRIQAVAEALIRTFTSLRIFRGPVKHPKFTDCRALAAAHWRQLATQAANGTIWVQNDSEKCTEPDEIVFVNAHGDAVAAETNWGKRVDVPRSLEMVEKGRIHDAAWSCEISLSHGRNYPKWTPSYMRLDHFNTSTLQHDAVRRMTPT